MSFFKRIRDWLSWNKTPPKLVGTDLSSEAARDIGVTVTRVRLPSGNQIVIIEKATYEE